MSLQQCPRCGKEFDRAFTTSPASLNCPACDQQLTQTVRTSLPTPRPILSSDAFPVTMVLIAASVLVFIVMVLRGVSAVDPTPQQAIAYGADFGPLTLGGQWWRLVTSMFVHFGIIHLGLNMWCLWNLGRAAERLLGRFSYLVAYFASGIFGSIASVYWHPQAAGGGASGAIFGLAGVLVSFVYLKKTPANLQINSKMLGSLGTFIAYNLLFGAAIPGISNAAHLGGLVMGFAVGALLPAASANESSRRTRLSLVVALTAIVLVASAIATKHITARASELVSIQQLLAAGNSDEALPKLQQLTAREPNLAPAQAMLASVYFQKSRYPEALAALQKAYDSDPKNVAYQERLSAAYFSLEQFDQAEALYRKIVTQNPNDSRAHLGLGYAFMGKKQYESAVSEFRLAVTLDPNDAVPLHALGEAQLHAGRYADAQQTYLQLLSLFPNDTRARAALDFATSQRH
jgi:membrane associated rhomboid family serine protease/Flp pilus assembly protein TadD